jgi:PAS domain S-box-containing protein
MGGKEKLKVLDADENAEVVVGLQSIYDAITDYLTVVDINYRIVNYNRVVEEQFGKDLVGRVCYEVYQAREEICPDCPVKEAIETKKPAFSFQPATDVGNDVEIYAFPIFNKKGEVVAVVEHGKDVTKRIEAERALLESEERWRSLVEESPDHIVTLDVDLKILYVNYASPGLTVEELVGTHIYDYVKDEDKQRIKKILNNVLKTGKTKIYETEYETPDGGIIYYETHATPRFFNKNITGITMTARDITEHKHVEEKLKRHALELEKSNQMKDLFTDIMSHDILNPVGIIMNFAEIIKNEENLKDEAMADAIIRNARRIEDMIQNATIYARLEAASEIEKEELDLAELIATTIEQLYPHAREKGINILFEPAEKHAIKASMTLGSAFENLISNAIKFGPGGSEVRIEIEDDGKSKIISFEDRGGGISDESKETIFERFTRREKKAVKGSGLGLAITKRIVEMHGGRVWVEDNPGGGSVFFVSLPKNT